MVFLKRIIFPLILLLIVACVFMIGALMHYGKSKANSTDQADTKTSGAIANLTNLDPTSYDSIVKNEFSLANEEAVAADNDNKLSAIDIQIGPDLSPSSVVSRYAFSSDKDTNNNWTMTFTEINTNFSRALIPKADYLGNISEINTGLWKFNFVTALQIAEKNGGLKWRESNKLDGVRLTLRYSDPNNWLLWSVQYKGDNSSLLVKIDANSGRVVTDDDTPPTVSN